MGVKTGNHTAPVDELQTESILELLEYDVENADNSPRGKGGSIDAIQIAGDHYKKVSYQHWNMVNEANLGYILGCATKYISRWQDKNGLEDLRKSIHYLEKADEDLLLPEENPEYYKYFKLFYTQFGNKEQEIFELIWLCEYGEAIKLINELIEEVECGPTSNYVDPDNNYIRG